MTVASVNDISLFLSKRTSWASEADNLGNKNEVVELYEFNLYLNKEWKKDEQDGKTLSSSIIKEFWKKYDTNDSLANIADEGKVKTTNKNGLDKTELEALNAAIKTAGIQNSVVTSYKSMIEDMCPDYLRNNGGLDGIKNNYAENWIKNMKSIIDDIAKGVATSDSTDQNYDYEKALTSALDAQLPEEMAEETEAQTEALVAEYLGIALANLDTTGTDAKGNSISELVNEAKTQVAGYITNLGEEPASTIQDIKDILDKLCKDIAAILLATNEQEDKSSKVWSTNVPSGTVGQAYNGKISLNVIDTKGEAVTDITYITEDALPEGLDFNNGDITGTPKIPCSTSITVTAMKDGEKVETTTVTITINKAEEKQTPDKKPEVYCPKYIYPGHTDSTGTAKLDGYTISSIDCAPAGSVGKNSDNGFTITAPANGYTEIKFTITMTDDDGNEIKCDEQTVTIKQMSDIGDSSALKASSDDATNPVGGMNENGWGSIEQARSRATNNLASYLNTIEKLLYQEADNSGKSYNMSAIKYAITTTKNYFTAIIDAVCDSAGYGVCGAANESVNISSRNYKDAKGNTLSTGNTSFTETSTDVKWKTLDWTDVDRSVSGVVLLEERNNGVDALFGGTASNMYKILIDKTDVKEKVKEFYNKYQNDPTTTYTSSDDTNPVDQDKRRKNDIDEKYKELEVYNNQTITSDTVNDFMKSLTQLKYESSAAVNITQADGLDKDDPNGNHEFYISVNYPDGYSSNSGSSVGTIHVYTKTADVTQDLWSLMGV